MSTLHQTFTQRGYVVVENVVDPTPLIADYQDRLNTVAALAVEAGWLSQTFDHLPFAERWAAVLRDADHNLYPYFDISLPNEKITAETPYHLSPAVYDLLQAPRLLDAVQALIGGEILANPIQHVRIKPPQAESEWVANQGTLVQTTGWHQDQGVYREEADTTDVITAWVAITDATIENGCLQVVPYSHRAGLTAHCPQESVVEIPVPHLAGQPVPVPVKAGSVLLMHRLMQHASLPNISRSIRWSFDLRFQPIGQPTGRDELPGLVVRSDTQPTAACEVWLAQWQQAKRDLVRQGSRQALNRWDATSDICL